MKFLFITLFSFYCLEYAKLIPSTNNQFKTRMDIARAIAIEDFSKTKLFKLDSVFYIKLYDTLHRIKDQRLNKGHYKSVVGTAYDGIIAVDILATPFKYLLDTTEKFETQNKTIPSQVFEKNGRVFLWRDKTYPLTDKSLRILTKYHLISRGSKNDINKFLVFGTDDSKRAAHYYFCRNNLSVHKRVITNIGIGYYDPPKVNCK